MTIMSPPGKSDHLPPDGAGKNSLVLWVSASPLTCAPSQVRGVLVLQYLEESPFSNICTLLIFTYLLRWCLF